MKADGLYGSCVKCPTIQLINREFIMSFFTPFLPTAPLSLKEFNLHVEEYYVILCICADLLLGDS
jgi:hypothetical protein